MAEVVCGAAIMSEARMAGEVGYGAVPDHAGGLPGGW